MSPIYCIFSCLEKFHLFLVVSSKEIEQEIATHSSTLAWKIPWTEEPCKLQSMGLQRVGHDWASLHFTKIIYNPDLPPDLFRAVSQRYLRYSLSDYSSHFAPNKTSLTTLMLCTFSTLVTLIYYPMPKLFRCFTNCVPKTFFILLISHKCIFGVKSIKAAWFGHFLSLVSMRSPCARNKMHSFSPC